MGQVFFKIPKKPAFTFRNKFWNKKIFSEMFRTETQFEESLSKKLFLMTSFNFYSHAFYIAFLKGK
jgi:hypothetical protein